MSTPSLLTSLLTLITTATHDLQVELSAAELPEPWIDNAQLHPWDEETPPKKYWDARRTLISALGMMIGVVQNPREKLVVEGFGYHHPAAFNFIVNTRIPDILCEPDVEERIGLPVSEIAKRAGTHPGKTERVLRFLCIYHVFQETSPNVFANNKVSHCFKTGQPNAEMPLFWGVHSFRSATALSATLRDPATSHSVDIRDSSFSHVFSPANPDTPMKVLTSTPAPPTTSTLEKEASKEEGRRITLFEFLARPSNAVYRSSFGNAMATFHIMNGSGGFLDFDWARWDHEGAVIVEVGASIGHLSLSVLPALKHSRFINQDLAGVCADGEKFFAEKNPQAIQSGKVVFQPNDFFTGQPVKGASIYILSNILHDWPDKEAVQILNHIVAAMAPTSRLLVIEIVTMPAISQSRSPPPLVDEKDLDGAPWPLLKDYGSVNRFAHHQGLEIINLLNGLDRTLGEYIALFDRVELELVRVHRIRKLVSIMEVKKRY